MDLPVTVHKCRSPLARSSLIRALCVRGRTALECRDRRTGRSRLRNDSDRGRLAVRLVGAGPRPCCRTDFAALAARWFARSAVGVEPDSARDIVERSSHGDRCRSRFGASHACLHRLVPDGHRDRRASCVERGFGSAASGRASPWCGPACSSTSRAPPSCQSGESITGSGGPALAKFWLSHLSAIAYQRQRAGILCGFAMARAPSFAITERFSTDARMRDDELGRCG